MTPVNLHQALILYSSLPFMASGLLILMVWQMLGPRYADHWTLGPKRRLVIFGLACGCFVRGATLVFPGEAVLASHVSCFMPVWATIVLAASLMVAELLSGQRLPPPVMERVMGMFAASRPSTRVAELMLTSRLKPISASRCGPGCTSCTSPARACGW